jgi:hypothetical protein
LSAITLKKPSAFKLSAQPEAFILHIYLEAHFRFQVWHILLPLPPQTLRQPST